MELYKRVVILLKNDNVDVQEISVTALGASNPDVFRFVDFRFVESRFVYFRFVYFRFANFRFAESRFIFFRFAESRFIFFRFVVVIQQTRSSLTLNTDLKRV